MKKSNLSAILFITITTFTIALSTQALADDSLYISEDGTVAVGTQDLDGSPAVGQVTIKGTTSDGSTNILVGRDSAETNVFSVNTDGKITGSSLTGKTITLSESITNDTSESQIYSVMYPTTTSSSTSYHIGSAHYLRPIISSGITQSGYEMGGRVQSMRNYRSTSINDNGTLSSLFGQQIQYGHHYTNTSASPVTTNVYGLILSPYYKTGTVTNWYDLYISAGSSGGTITNRYAIYQASTVAKNYFGGNVGIGTTSPSTELTVYGTKGIQWSDDYLTWRLGRNYTDYASTAYAHFTTGSGGEHQNLALGTLYAYGYVSAISYYTHSDESIKKNIQPIPNALDKILQLKGVDFEWEENGEKSVGLIAQDVEKVFPELVKTMDVDAKSSKAVAYGNLVAPLIEAVKELKTENNDLLDLIDELEDRIAKLEQIK